MTKFNLSHFYTRRQIPITQRVNTDIPTYSDTLWTKLKCHCNRGVTGKGGFLIVMIDLGPAQSVTISGMSL